MTGVAPYDGTRGVTEVADAVRAGEVSVTAVVDATLDRVEAHGPAFNAFTHVAAERARARAADLDRRRAAGEDLGPLAGVPFAAKNLLDIQGIPTRAGSKIRRAAPPAPRDAFVVRNLEAAGAVLVGATHMGEWAYDFTGRNAHDGPARNPRDRERMTGGSSSGSAAATAAGLVPFAVGSDTNGSIRVPAAFCGIFGIKPTYGRIARSGAFFLSSSLDHLGPFTRSVRDLALVYDVMQGLDPADPAQASRPPQHTMPLLDRGIEGLRIGVAGGHFAAGGQPEVHDAAARAADALGARRAVDLPGAARARSAAFVITAVEAANLHLQRLRDTAADFDPETRPRLLAGALIPGGWYAQAQRYRRWFRDEVARAFRDVDVLLAPTAPLPPPLIDQQTMTLDGRELLIRPHLGIFSQPLSFIGVPIVNVPLWPGEPGRGLPLGVQVIGRPWEEDVVLRVALALEQRGIAMAPVAALPGE